MENQKKFYTQAELEETAEGKLFIASTEVVDREGEILSIDGWDLKNFKKNPVLLWAHDYREPPVGIAKGIGIKEINGKKKLTFEPKFHEITERAKELAKMVEAGIIRTVSVGFLPKERDGNKYTSQELLEISFVPVPANPEALSLAYSKGFKSEQLKEFFEVSVNDESEEKSDDVAQLKGEVTDIKNQISDLVEGIKHLTPAVEKENKGRTVDTAKVHSLRRNAQIVQKSIELILMEIKKWEE